MDIDKDYYAVLGVLPSIDNEALKAVYRALVKKFHPDVFKGDPREAERITKNLTEAYSILGDPNLRSQYDEKRQSKMEHSGNFSDQEDASTGTTDLNPEQDVVWEYICRYYPSVPSEYRDIKKFSENLALQFRLVLIENKISERSKEIHDHMINAFLVRYFGTNPIIQEYVAQALRLGVPGRRKIALEINKAIRILGSPSTDPMAKSFISQAIAANGFFFEVGEMVKHSRLGVGRIQGPGTMPDSYIVFFRAKNFQTSVATGDLSRCS